MDKAGYCHSPVKEGQNQVGAQKVEPKGVWARGRANVELIKPGR